MNASPMRFVMAVFEGHSVRVLEDAQGDPAFALVDICRVLGLDRTVARQLIQRHIQVFRGRFRGVVTTPRSTPETGA